MATQHQYKPRRAQEPGQVVTYHNVFGEQVDLKADADGLIWPKSAGDVDVLEGLGFPVARKATAQPTAAGKAAKKKS